MFDEFELQLNTRVIRSTPVGGGSISSAWKCELADGRTVFVKNAPPGAPPGMFEQETLALRTIERTATVRVPAVLACAESWLALEWLEPTSGGATAWSRLGTELARMHAARGAALHGWAADNFIGPLAQRNSLTARWTEFWRDQRLLPQFELAGDRLEATTRRAFDRLITTLEERLECASAEGPSLLHGDLWHGNVLHTSGGAALVDPASSYGHREVDLAMAALFGGFPAEFRAAYEAEWPLQPGAAERRAVYQLYYLLVHVNLFGGSYVQQTRTLLKALV